MSEDMQWDAMKTSLKTMLAIHVHLCNCLGKDLESLARQNLLGNVNLGLGRSSLLMGNGLGNALHGQNPFFRRPFIEAWNLQQIGGLLLVLGDFWWVKVDQSIVGLLGGYLMKRTDGWSNLLSCFPCRKRTCQLRKCQCHGPNLATMATSRALVNERKMYVVGFASKVPYACTMVEKVDERKRWKWSRVKIMARFCTYSTLLH